MNEIKRETARLLLKIITYASDRSLRLSQWFDGLANKIVAKYL